MSADHYISKLVFTPDIFIYMVHRLVDASAVYVGSFEDCKKFITGTPIERTQLRWRSAFKLPPKGND